MTFLFKEILFNTKFSILFVTKKIFYVLLFTSNAVAHYVEKKCIINLLF